MEDFMQAIMFAFTLMFGPFLLFIGGWSIYSMFMPDEWPNDHATNKYNIMWITCALILLVILDYLILIVYNPFWKGF